MARRNTEIPVSDNRPEQAVVRQPKVDLPALLPEQEDTLPLFHLLIIQLCQSLALSGYSAQVLSVYSE